MKSQQTHRSGFTLIELSIVLVLLSMLLSGILSVVSQNIRHERTVTLATRLDAIEQALLNYRLLYNRLPCPANGTLLVTSANYGIEGAVPGTCSGGTPAANYSDSNTAGGVLPSKTLGLPDEYMFDPWGGRFTYAVDKVMTTNNSFTTHPPNDTTIGGITVLDASAGNRTVHAIVAIVSHGPDGHGAFQLSGVRKSIGASNADELTNCHCDFAGAASTFNSNFISQPATGAAGDMVNIFDDTVRYYTRSQFLSATEALP